jgi:hypothetical protein
MRDYGNTYSKEKSRTEGGRGVAATVAFFGDAERRWSVSSYVRDSSSESTYLLGGLVARLTLSSSVPLVFVDVPEEVLSVLPMPKGSAHQI